MSNIRAISGAKVLVCLAGLSALVCSLPTAAKETAPVLTFCCTSSNDLYVSLGKIFPRYETAPEAVFKASPGSAVLVLADGYPERPTVVGQEVFDLASRKRLRVFLEYPAAVPGLMVGPARFTTWERIVIASPRFDHALPRLRLLAANECRFLPVVGITNSDLVVARVAGYDTAVFGIPETNSFPILFQVPSRHLTIATTRLSHFVTGRFAPARDWIALWERLLNELAPGNRFKLEANPVVRPAFGPRQKLPRAYERKALGAAARWLENADLLVHPTEKDAIYSALRGGVETIEPARSSTLAGDGSLGILEGYASGISHDGTQLRRLPLRADCQAESAMVLAIYGSIEGNKRSAVVASNLLDFVYFNSGMCRGARDNPAHPAFGLIGWGDLAPAWLVANYGDDNARTLLATMVAAASLKTCRWDARVMRALLANLRTTGQFGFRGDRIDIPDLERNGWKFYYHGKTINYSPHFEAYLWACYLWAYRQTGYPAFLERARAGISMTMKVYPGQWRWQDNLERAHMLLSLAWLVRVEDTPLHRQWLKAVASDLIAWQRASGSIHERLGPAQGGHYRTPQRNEEYGTAETPLLQENGDPVSDQLYTTGFALLGLHEAVAATGDKALRQAEDKLAEFLCRVQTRSEKFPWLEGTWFRAWDDRRWEAWASSADIGWGAWCLESGWAQAWTAATLGLREQRANVWDLTLRSQVRDHFEELRAQMGLD